MKGSERSGIAIGHALVKENGRNYRDPETILGNETDHGIERGLAREILQKPEKCGKGTGDPDTNQAVLPGLIGLEVQPVH